MNLNIIVVCHFWLAGLWLSTEQKITKKISCYVICVSVVKRWLYNTGMYTERERAVVRTASNRFRAIIVVFYVWWVFQAFLCWCAVKNLHTPVSSFAQSYLCSCEIIEPHHKVGLYAMMLFVRLFVCLSSQLLPYSGSHQGCPIGFLPI